MLNNHRKKTHYLYLSSFLNLHCSFSLNQSFALNLIDYSEVCNLNLKKQKTSMTAVINKNSDFLKKRVNSENLNLGPGIKYVYFNVRLKGAPFYDFFANEIKDDTSVVKSRSVDSPGFDLETPESNVSDLSVTLSLSYSNDTGDDKIKKGVVKRRELCSDLKNPGSNDCDLSLSLSLPYYSNHSTVASECNSHKQNHPDSETTVNSVVDPSVSSCSEIPTDIEVPIEAVSLRMFNPVIPPEQVEWTMKNKLTESDCNAQHRLMISKNLVEDQVISHLDELDRFEISSLKGLRVDVLDCDMGIQLMLTLKKWPSSKTIHISNPLTPSTQLKNYFLSLPHTPTHFHNLY